MAEPAPRSFDGPSTAGPPPPRPVSDGARQLKAVQRRARRQRRLAQQQREWLLAVQQQRLIDAEMWSTRRELLQKARLRGPRGEFGFLGDDFLAAADQETLYRAIIGAALGMGWVSSVDLRLFDTARTLQVVAAQVMAEPLLAELEPEVTAQAVHRYPLQREGEEAVGVLSLRGHRAQGGQRGAEELARGATDALARVVHPGSSGGTARKGVIATISGPAA